MSRFEKLKELLQTDPDNEFARYGLAMECRSQGNLQEAAELFRILLERNPGYVPAFLHYGMVLYDLGNRAEAIRVFERGISVCCERNETHAAEELHGALLQVGTGQENGYP